MPGISLAAAGATSTQGSFIGSLVIKHKLGLSDEEIVRIIGENPYIQFFLGLNEFSPALLSSSLFVEWRKRLGNETFNGFVDVLTNNLPRRVQGNGKSRKGTQTKAGSS